MSITAKFPSTCAACGGKIAVGTKIEWTKGQPARHSVCPTARASAKPVVPRAPKSPSPPRVEGEREVSRPSRGRDDGYEAGAVTRLLNVAGGGGPDGHYWVVIEQTGKWRDDDTDEWMVAARVRPATDAECAPAVSRLAAKELRQHLARDLGAARGERVAGAMPEGATVLVPRDAAKSIATGERVAIVDGAILHERVGDPDMCDSWHHYVVRIVDAPAELVGRVQAYIAAAAK